MTDEPDDTAPIIVPVEVAWRFHCSAATHPGARRRHNQDACLSRPDLGLWAVADGAGGHQDGAMAAQAIVATLDEIPAGLDGPALLGEVRRRLSGAHAALRAQARQHGEAAVMASTVVVLIVHDGHFACLWAGDSRAYRAVDTRLETLTRDHSLVQEMVDAGTLGAAEAETHAQANVITRAVGADTAELVLDKVTGPLMAGDDRFLLCSDGLWKAVREPEMAALLSGDSDAAEMIAAAVECDAADNVTAVSVRVTLA